MNAEDEIKRIREVERGQRANDLLENEIFKEALDTVESSLVEQWKHSDVFDVELQQRLRLMFALLSNFNKAITKIIETGQLANAQLTQIEEKKKRFAFMKSKRRT